MPLGESQLGAQARGGDGFATRPSVRATATQRDEEQASGRGVTKPLSDWTRDTWDTQSPHVSVSSSVKQE